jgi:large subunit ribosomal protein L35
MPKMKTNSSAKKRFAKKGDGKVKFTQAFRRHLLTKKTTKRKRALRNSKYVGSTDVARVLRLLPNN